MNLQTTGTALASRLIAATLFAICGSCQHQPSRIELPARFEQNRIFLVPETEEGRTIVFFTDTGGGVNGINLSAASDLTGSSIEVGDSIAFPNFDPESTIPRNELYLDGNLKIFSDEVLTDSDGFLGGRWFGNRIWEFDYRNRKLSLLSRFVVSKKATDHSVNLGFQIDDEGLRTMHFPSMPIEIDGQKINVLLDTGARATLTDGAATLLGQARGASIGTSFIVRSIFEEWRRMHPDWAVIPSGDMMRGQTAPMIEVPEVTIGGHMVGPVWFTVRGDHNFVNYMSSMMDKTIHGAIGGSGLQYFRVVVDYPNSVAYFSFDES